MLINSKKMLNNALEKQKAILQFNINNLEWIKYILEECNANNCPVILGVSETTIKYMGGAYTIVSVVNALMSDLNINIPVCLHLDHGKSFVSCKQCIDAGFTSVMIDASMQSLEDNIVVVQEVVKYAHQRNVTVEAEVGNIDQKQLANLDDCIKFVKETSVDSLAPSVGNVHGIYQGTPQLNFNLVQEIRRNVSIPLVLHGGTGINNADIKKMILSGISKININTELQLAWSQSVRKLLKENDHVYDPRQIISSGEKSLKSVVKQKIICFSSIEE